MSSCDLFLETDFEQLAELVAVVSKSDELQRQLHAVPHSDVQRELVRTRICAFNLSDAEERDRKGARMPV
jgi:hypothetical protein